MNERTARVAELLDRTLPRERDGKDELVLTPEILELAPALRGEQWGELVLVDLRAINWLLRDSLWAPRARGPWTIIGGVVLSHVRCIDDVLQAYLVHVGGRCVVPVPLRTFCTTHRLVRIRDVTRPGRYDGGPC